MFLATQQEGRCRSEAETTMQIFNVFSLENPICNTKIMRFAKVIFVFIAFGVIILYIANPLQCARIYESMN